MEESQYCIHWTEDNFEKKKTNITSLNLNLIEIWYNFRGYQVTRKSKNVINVVKNGKQQSSVALLHKCMKFEKLQAVKSS